MAVVKAIGYFREDSAQAAAQPALAEQNRGFLEFCRREGCDVGATFLDSDPHQNPGFRQMLEYLRCNGSNAHVVVDSLERLGADVRSTAHAYFQLDSLGVTLISLDGTTRMTEALIAAWGTRDASERMGERVRQAMRRKAIKGEVLGRPPYGYRIGPRRRLEPVPDEAAVVRTIFRLYTQESLGIRLIAKHLNEEGFRTRRGGNWSMVTIRDILRNRAYLGTYARFGVRVPGSHAAIIATQEYQRAQDRMSRRRHAGGTRATMPFLLSGLVYCGYCGNRLIGVSRRQRWQRRGDGAAVQAEYRYYQCETRTNQSMCDYHTQRAEKLEEEVRAYLELELLNHADAPQDTLTPLKDPDRRALRLRLRLLDRRLEQVLDAGASGRLPVEDVHTIGIELAQRELFLEDQLAAIDRRATLQQSREQRRSARLELARSLSVETWSGLPVPERQHMLRRLIERVTVRDDGIAIAVQPI